MDDDLRGVTEMFARRGLASSSAAMGKAAKVRGEYADRKANILGGILQEDMDKAEKYRVADIDRMNEIDMQRYRQLQDIINMAQSAGSGSPYTPASMAEYESSLAKRQAWDNKWNGIIGLAGDLGSAWATGGASLLGKKNSAIKNAKSYLG
jgi:hypothetical protein